MHHGRVGPARGSFVGHGRFDRPLVRFQEIDLERPRRRSDDAFVLEVVDLDERIVPVARHDLALGPEQLQRRLVLVFVELVGILDAELRLLVHEVERRVGDVDRAVERLDSALVGLAVRQVLFLEHDRPALRRFLEDVGVVGEHVGTPLVGNAVVRAVDRVPRSILQTLVDVLPGRNEVDVDRLYALAGDEPERCIARRGDEIEAAFVHQGDHFVRRSGRLDVDLAAGRLLEVGDPVVVLVRFSPFDVAGPGDDVDLAFPGAHFLLHLLRAGNRRDRTDRNRRHEKTVSMIHDFSSRSGQRTIVQSAAGLNVACCTGLMMVLTTRPKLAFSLPEGKDGLNTFPPGSGLRMSAATARPEIETMP